MIEPGAAELLAWDREHLWHPYTSMTKPTPVRLVTGADGVRLRFADGSLVIDAMASWWSAIHGYNHPTLNRAASQQLDSMAHVMFGGLTHEPAIRLGQRLVDLTPEGLEHVFLADSGSVSIEVALKMVLQYQRGCGRPRRTRMLTVLGGYHGDTCGCMGVCDPDNGMHSMFQATVPQHVFAPRPPAVGADIDEWAEAFRKVAAENIDELAGIIVEPLLQGAGGMWPYPPACLHVMREVADEHNLVLVFDEIATGFGRTGTMFAAEAAGVAPDIMCVGKALTGGYLTLAAVLCTPTIARGLSDSESGVLMHGPTYMGNPLACALALANVDLLTASDWSVNVQRISTRLTQGLSPVRELPGVIDVRILGAVAAIQLDRPVDVARATEAALTAGVWIRPFRDLIYTMPPYITTDADIETICSALRAAALA